MEKSKENALNDFVDASNEKETNKKKKTSKRKVFEIIDRTLITEDGRQLLREQH